MERGKPAPRWGLVGSSGVNPGGNDPLQVGFDGVWWWKEVEAEDDDLPHPLVQRVGVFQRFSVEFSLELPGGCWVSQSWD